MFRRAMRLGRLALLASAASCALYVQRPMVAEPSHEELWMYQTMRRVLFSQKYREVRFPDLRTKGQPSVLVLYTRKVWASKDFQDSLSKGTASAHRLGYELTELFIDSPESLPDYAKGLGLSTEELKYRLENNSAVFYLEGDKTIVLPGNVSTSEIDTWVEKCQRPVIEPKDLAHYYYLARKAIRGEDSYMILTVDSSPEDLVNLKAYSIAQIQVPILEAGPELAKELQLQKGIYVTRMFSRLDGEKDVNKMGMLQYLKYDGKVLDTNTFHRWVATARQPVIGYVSDIDKVYPLLVRIHSGSRKCILVLTSQMNHHSKHYQTLLDSLLRLQTQYKDRITIAIIPSDQIAGKMSMVRDKKMKQRRLPEVRFIDYNKMISTVPGPDGIFPVVDCTAQDAKCADLSDTHYSRKTALKDEDLTFEKLSQFLEDSEAGRVTQYYETKPLPLRNAKKLNVENFKAEVLESSEDVLLEIYGKYCPACRAFAPKFDVLAGELKAFQGKLRVVKVCSDYNFIPELSDRKPYTPIFWYYKSGHKDAPIKYEGANKSEDLKAFIQQNASFPMSVDPPTSKS